MYVSLHLAVICIARCQTRHSQRTCQVSISLHQYVNAFTEPSSFPLHRFSTWNSQYWDQVLILLPASICETAALDLLIHITLQKSSLYVLSHIYWSSGDGMVSVRSIQAFSNVGILRFRELPPDCFWLLIGRNVRRKAIRRAWTYADGKQRWNTENHIRYSRENASIDTSWKQSSTFTARVNCCMEGCSFEQDVIQL